MTYRFDLNEQYSKRLEEEAAKERMSIQEYIRFRLFSEKTIFCVDEVVKRVLTGDFENKEFCVPDVYSAEEWANIDRGNAGVLGKNFYIYITEHPELGIRHIPNRTIKRRTAYIYNKKEN